MTENTAVKAGRLEASEVVTSPYMTVPQAARALDTRPDTVRRWLQAGRIKGRKFGPKIWRVDPASVRALVE